MTIDLRKTMSDALKGYQVHQLSVDGDTIVAHATDKNGRDFVLRLEPLAAAATVAEPAAEPTPEPAPVEPTLLRPTTMAPKSATNEALRRIAQSPKLSSEAQSMVARLARETLRPGHEVKVLEAAQASTRGDLGPLRDLVRQYRPPQEMHS